MMLRSGVALEVMWGCIHLGYLGCFLAICRNNQRGRLSTVSEEPGQFWEKIPNRIGVRKEKSVPGFKASVDWFTFLVGGSKFNSLLVWIWETSFQFLLIPPKNKFYIDLNILNGVIILICKRHSFLISYCPGLLQFPNWCNVMVSRTLKKVSVVGIASYPQCST